MGTQPTPGNRSHARLGAVISRRLRARGYRIMPSARRLAAEGITVRQVGDNYARVLIDLPGTTRREALAEEIAETLQDMGYEVSRLDYGDAPMAGVSVRVRA